MSIIRGHRVRLRLTCLGVVRLIDDGTQLHVSIDDTLIGAADWTKEHLLALEVEEQSDALAPARAKLCQARRQLAHSMEQKQPASRS